MPLQNPPAIRYAPEPADDLKLPANAASEMAAATAIATNRHDDFDRYRVAFQNTGRLREWQEFQFNYNYARDTQAKERLFQNVQRRAKELALPVTDADIVAGAVPIAQAEAAAKRDALTPGVMTAGLNQAAAEDDNAETTNQLLSSWGNIDHYINADAKANQDVVNEANSFFAEFGSQGDWETLAKGNASLAADMYLPTDTAAWMYVAGKMGIPKNYFAGENAKGISEYFKTLPPEQRGPEFKRFLSIISDTPGMGGFRAWGMASSVADLDTGKIDTSTIDRVINDIGSALDPIMVGGIIKAGARGIKAGAGGITARVLARTAPKSARQYMGMLLDNLKKDPRAKNWNISPTTIAGTQLPKPRLPIGRDHIPDGVIETAERTAQLRDDLNKITASTRSTLFTPDEVINSVAQRGRDIEEANKGKIRAALSQIAVHEDGTAVEFRTMLGRTNENGFATFRDATRRAEDLKDLGEEVKVFKVDDTGSLVEATKSERGVGDYYVELKQTHYVRPEDKAIFGGDPIAGNSWLGAAGRWLLPPSSEFDPKIFNSFLKNTLKESAITAKLEQIAAPIFRDLNTFERQTVSKMWTWTDDFGRKQSRIPSYDELIEAFPDAKPSEIRGWYQTKLFYDTVYDMNNLRMYRDMAGRGFKTLRGTETTYHGAPVLRENAAKTLLDPVTNETRTLSKAELDGIYDNGGTVLKLDTAVEGTGKNMHSYVLAENGVAGWSLKPLERNVLRYIPGYYPRIYKDYHFIQRTTKSVVDGVEREHTAGVTVARTRKEAEVMVERLQAKTKDKDTIYSVGDDSRLSGRDRTAMDLDRLRTEGRLFFDERNAQRLYDVNGNPAEIVDPINMLSRTARLVGRQVAMEDLIKAQKTSWQQTFGDMVKGDFERMTGSAVAAEIKEISKSGGPAAAKRATQASQWWDYIRTMEGTTPEVQLFKRQAIQGAEFMYNALRKVPGGRALTTPAVRGAHNVNPVQWLKGLAYFDFLTTRPVRQLILQASQSLFVAPLIAGRPKLAPYLARWHLDSMWLMQGAKRRGLAETGGKAMSNGLIYRNAKLMNMSKEDYTNLVEHFENSGLLQTVNIHSFAGDLPAATSYHPESAIGGAVKAALKPATATVGLLRKGFDLGEQFNLTASYMAALKVYMHDGKIAKISQLTDNQWDDIATRASDYALSMNRANASKYQYGLISLPMQFLSFTHKATMVGLKAASFGKLGPKNMSVGDAYKILAGQFIMFGGAGFGIKQEMEQLMSESGFGDYVGTEVSDIISGGVLDHILDKSLQSIADDPELDLAFDEFLAPGANIINVIRKFSEAWSEGGLKDAAFGPSSTTIGRIGEAINITSTISAADELPLDDGQKAGIIADAFLSGVASGYNDWIQARAAAHAERWINSKGDQTGLESKWAEVIAKGAIGLQPESKLDAYEITNDMAKHEQMIKQTAQDYYNRANLLINKWADGQLNQDQFRTKMAVEKSMLAGLEEFERMAVQKEYNKLIARDRGPRQGLEYVIAQRLTHGVPPDKALRDQIAKTPAIQDEAQREALLKWVDQIMAEQPDATARYQQLLDEELAKVKN